MKDLVTARQKLKSNLYFSHPFSVGGRAKQRNHYIQSTRINRYRVNRYILRFLGNFRKMSTKSTTKLEKFLNRYTFLKKLP